MPRTLPWLVQAAKKQAPKAGASSSSPAPRRRRAATPDDLVDSDLNTTGVATPARRQKKRQARTPSTSPPPAPPDVEYMREGDSADDGWVMVEDEFVSTAQTFTQHIHHAEYVRLKKLAKSRGAGTLQAIARPTDGRTEQSTSTKLRIEAERRAGKVKEGMKALVGPEESDDEEDTYMQDPQLAGLMTGSQRAGQELTGIAKARANTRAAAGFAKSPQKVRRTRDAETSGARQGKKAAAPPQQRKPATDDSREGDDDDLDEAPAKPIKVAYKQSPTKRPHANGEASTRSTRDSKGRAGPPDIFKCFAEPAKERPRLSEGNEAEASQRGAQREEQDRAVPSRRPPSPSSDSDTKARNARSQAAPSFLAKRRAAREKKEQEEKRMEKRVTIDVPTFAI